MIWPPSHSGFCTMVFSVAFGNIGTESVRLSNSPPQNRRKYWPRGFRGALDDPGKQYERWDFMGYYFTNIGISMQVSGPSRIIIG